MKRFTMVAALAATTAVAIPTLSSAADWTGAYGGLQLGYGDVTTSGAATLSGSDAIGGLTMGYDYDMGDWVVGAGLDYDFANIDVGGATTLKNVARLKVRAGYEIGSGLLYGTAGGARAMTDTLGDDNGWFAGLGYEHKVTNNITVGGEVLYHQFDNFNSSGIKIEATTAQIRTTFRF